MAVPALMLVLWACRPAGAEPVGKAPGVVHMDIGITYLAVAPGMATNYGLDRGEGVIVTAVTPRSRAARGGLEVGDVVLTFDGTPVDGDHTLLELLADCPADQPMIVVILREGCATALELPAE